jgi:hypothetical protein
MCGQIPPRSKGRRPEGGFARFATMLSDKTGKRAWRTLTRLCKPPSPTHRLRFKSRNTHWYQTTKCAFDMQFLRYATEPRTSYKIVDHSFLQLKKEDASNTGTQTSEDTAGSPSPSGINKQRILIKEKPDVFHTQNIRNSMPFSASKTCDVDRITMNVCLADVLSPSARTHAALPVPILSPPPTPPRPPHAARASVAVQKRRRALPHRHWRGLL